MLKIGKIPESVLKKNILSQLSVRRPEVLLGPHVGEDCGVVAFDADEVCVLSSDPITGTVEDIGNLAVQVTVNDLAAGGAEPIGLMLTILLPDGYEEDALAGMIKQLNEACEALSLQVIGGHTEVTKAVNQPIISVTGVGKVKKDKLMSKAKVEAGMDIIMTKWAGVEGTAIIAKAKEAELKAHFNSDFVMEAQNLKRHLSVLTEGRIGMEVGAAMMHDVTEGGIFGALWELAANARKGIEIKLDLIPMKQETIEICEYYDINPYKLISSGSMLIVTDQGELLVERVRAEGIEATIIGKITDNNDKLILQEDTVGYLEPPKADELYKVL